MHSRKSTESGLIEGGTMSEIRLIRQLFLATALFGFGLFCALPVAAAPAKENRSKVLIGKQAYKLKKASLSPSDLIVDLDAEIIAEYDDAILVSIGKHEMQK